MPEQYTLRVRIDRELRDRAAAVLHAVGLTTTDAVRTLLIRIAEDKELPHKLFPPSDAAIDAARDKLDEFDRRYDPQRKVPRRP